MLDVRAILVDFDGTACTRDVSEALLEDFGDPSWPAYDEAVDGGEMGLREAARIQAAMLRGTREEMLAHAMTTCAIDRTFPDFVEWARRRSVPLAVVSDGWGFYVRPMLEAAGITDIRVITNDLRLGAAGPELLHPNANPDCVGCGTCKMLATVDYRRRCGPVAFVGEGQSDRFGALYADVVFAKDALPAICERDGVPFLPWNDFDDVRRALENRTTLPGPIAPEVCPGWIPAE